MHKPEFALATVQCLQNDLQIVAEVDAEASHSTPATKPTHSLLKGELKTGSHWLIRGYVLMILPQVHLRNGE